jgi:hypothetical protein
MANKKEYKCVQCGVDLFRPKADHLKANERCHKCNKENRRKRLAREQDVPEKACTRCGETKPRTADYFPLHNKKADGLDSWCRKCRASYRSGIRRGVYRSMISDEQLKENLTNIKNCQICGKEEELVVDHCHSKMLYRGLLCNHCNRGLGHFMDDPEIMTSAIEYIKKHN